VRLAVGRPASSSSLGATLQLTPFASSVRATVERAALSCSKTTRVLAPPSPTMRLAVLGVAFSGLQAVLLLAPPASSVRLAVGRPACNSPLGATLQLAPPASAVRDTVRRATCSNPLGTARQLTLPLAHGTPPGSRWCRPNCGPPFTAVTHPPLSPQRFASAYRTQHTRRWPVREQVRRWVQHVSIKMVNSAWAGDVRWVCSQR
jgi:hypothetical protein